MNVKIDTKEKFHVITLNEPVLAANMTEDLIQMFNNCTQGSVKNIVLNLENVKGLEIGVEAQLVLAQQEAYENNRSFVICCMIPEVEAGFDKDGMLELMNVTPTQSEAWDIVQMEEIERELFDDEVE